MKFGLDRWQTVWEKKENAIYQHFILLSTMFLKAFFHSIIKSRDSLVTDSLNLYFVIDFQSVKEMWEKSYYHVTKRSWTHCLYGNSQVNGLVEIVITLNWTIRVVFLWPWTGRLLNTPRKKEKMLVTSIFPFPAMFPSLIQTEITISTIFSVCKSSILSFGNRF